MELLKNQWKRRSKELRLFVISAVCLFLVGLLLFSVIGAGDKDEIFVVPVGTMLAMMMAGCIHLFYVSYGVVSEFNLAVGMGITRRRFVPGYIAFSALELIGIIIAGLLLNRIELRVYRTTMPGVPMAEEVKYLFDVRMLVLLTLGMLAAEMLAGALILRFGRRAVIGIWFFIIAAAQLPVWMPRWDSLRRAVMPVVNEIMNFFGRMESFQITIFIVIIEFMALLVSWRLMRKQCVTA